MGFYSVITLKVTPEGIADKKASEISGHNPICEDGIYPETNEGIWPAKFDQLLLEFDISSFSTRNSGGIEKDSENNYIHLPVNDIKAVLQTVKDSGKTAIVRFAYDPDFDGDGQNRDVEPADFKAILFHIEDICHAVKDYSKVITALQCGMIGPWGEMNFTTYANNMSNEDFETLSSNFSLGLTASPDNGNNIEHGYILLVMRQFTKCLEDNNCDLPLLVRQPRFIYDYLKRRNSAFSFDCENLPAAFIPQENNKEFYRLGLYNDGYLGSSDDTGTYTLGNRAGEVAFIQEFTKHTPYGGELIGDYGISGENFSSINEMFKVHLSYLNIAWNPSFFRRFNQLSYQGETVFRYLIKHMGYRFLLTDSVFKYPENKASLTAELKIENKGFANIPYHRKKSMTVIFEKAGNVVMERTVSGLTFDGSDKALTVDTSSLTSGSYSVYLKISDSDGAYPIRLANNLWKEELKANKIGSFTK